MQSVKYIYIIATYSFREIIKSKILIYMGLVGCSMMFISFIAAEFTYGVPSIVAVDFGLGVMSFSSLAMSIFIGSRLIQQEIDMQTLPVILTKPIKRMSFILGKFFGLFGVILVNCSILTLFILLIKYFFLEALNPLLAPVILSVFLEAVVILAMTLLFSLLTNPILTSLYSILILLLSHSIESASQFASEHAQSHYIFVIKWIKYLLPPLWSINFKNYYLYDQFISTNQVAINLISVTIYLIMVLLVTCIIFNKKQFE